jgi:hypothetical protein
MKERVVISTHLVGHYRPHPGRSRVMKHRRHVRAPRAIAPDELALFSERLDHEREYESTVRDFVQMHDRVLSADDYNS